jgi:hypothetical protein
MGDNNTGSRLGNDRVMALYRRSPRQKKNLFHRALFVALPPRILETAGVPLVVAVMKSPPCWTGKSLDSSNHKDHMAHDRLLHLSRHAPHTVASTDTRPSSIWTAFPRTRNPHFSLSLTPKFHADYIAGFDEGVLVSWIMYTRQGQELCHGGGR